MATYSYRCPGEFAHTYDETGHPRSLPNTEHVIDEVFKIGTQPPYIHCAAHARVADRDFAAEIPTQYVKNDDPFRKAWLGDAEQRAADQGRCLDPEAPRDKFEAKERHQRLGRVYIGDDVTKLSEKGQKAIAHGKGLAN